MGQLQGKVAIITGAGSGIGEAIAQRFARQGAHVEVWDLSLDSAQRVAAEIQAAGGSAAACAVDVSSLESVKTAFAQSLSRRSRIDILVNNAGMQRRGPLHEFSDAHWREILRTNLDSAFFVAQSVARHMIARQRGRIINICSVQSELGRPGIAPYMATKGGLKMLTKGMAIDWGPLGINANGIGPGYFKTELNEKLYTDETFSQWPVGRTPSRRWGEVEELAGAAVFLASEASSFVNGHILYVDGGVTATL